MTCYKCGGHMIEMRVRFCACDASPPLFVENTPALVCSQCGTRVYSDETMEALEQLAQGHVGPGRMTLVATYAFADLVDPRAVPIISVMSMATAGGSGIIWELSG